MSESANLAGGKVTYLDGHIVNTGNRTITGITVQVLFRDPAHEVAQNETQPLKLIRMRRPYIDVEPVSAAPLKSGDQRDFRLIFDTVAEDWDGAYPEVRIVHVDRSSNRPQFSTCISPGSAVESSTQTVHAQNLRFAAGRLSPLHSRKYPTVKKLHGSLRRNPAVGSIRHFPVKHLITLTYN